MKEWMERLESLMLDPAQNIDEMVEQSTQAKSKDIGMINDVSGAGIMAKETGVLEGFSYYNLGFRFDPKTMSLSFYAPNVQFFTSNFQVIDGDREFNALNEEFEEILTKIGGGAGGQV